MMFRGGGNIQEAKIAWRRPTLFEALYSGCFLFTICMIVPIVWDIASGSEADYERSFWYALAFGSAYGVSSLLFKSKLVVLR